jgi:hypothetical protein
MLSLLLTAALTISGAHTHDRVGSAIANAGDVNGDGVPDMIVGEQFSGTARAGAAYVVFGRRGRVDLGRFGSRGFRIDGPGREAHAGFAVAGAGDVNGDGLGDLVVGAAGGGFLDTREGEAYVVYGKRDSAPVDLGHLGASGFRMTGSPGGQLGFAVKGAGDVNGDGLDDVIVGDPNGGTGHAYVVFGARVPADVDVDALGTQGYAIAIADGDAGFSVAGVGDMNGDGRDDVAVAEADDGLAWVVFGAASAAPVDLAALGARGFRVEPLGKPDDGIDEVAAAGDVNADGRPDLVLGASGEDVGRDSGGAWVVYGSASTQTVRVSHIGRRGFHIRGRPGDELGTSIDGAGDIDGDGHADLVLGSFARGAGAAYVVFGRSRRELDLTRLAGRAIRLPGRVAGARLGWSVAGVPNADGKGHDGVLIGAPHAKRGARTSVGAASLYISKRRSG